MKKITNEIIGYFLLIIGFFGLFVAPILLLFYMNPGFMYFKYWEVQIGWVVMVFVCMITLQNKPLN